MQVFSGELVYRPWRLWGGEKCELPKKRWWEAKEEPVSKLLPIFFKFQSISILANRTKKPEK